MLVLDLTEYKQDSPWWYIPYEKSKFPGGELHLRLNKSDKVANYEEDYFYDYVEIRTRLNSSDDIIQLCLAVDALRRLGVKGIDVYIPYIPYGRQDRVCNNGESFSLKVVAGIINGLGFDKVKTYDPHSEVTSALINNLELIDNKLLLKYHVNNYEVNDFNLLVPDAGAIKRCYKIADNYLKFWELANINLVQCNKVRDLKTTKILRTEVPKIENELPCYIVDDICDGGRTFIEIAKKVRENGNNNDLYLVVSHGIFSAGEVELAKYFKKIYTTNSIRNDDYSINIGLRPEPSKLIKRFKLW